MKNKMKKIVITGASKGIGAAIALKFAAEGHKVAVCARNEKHLQALAAQSKDFMFPIIYKACDVAVKEELVQFYDFVNEYFGGEAIDILVNNAGIFIPGQIHNEEEGVFEETLKINLHSAYHLTRLFLPEMINRKNGHIFNMCSTASITAYTNGGSYCISKFALYGMTKVLREELKPHNIKVTAILPGATFTNSWSGTDLPEERFMKAEDVAEVIFQTSLLSASAVVEEILMRPVLGDI
jgi:short-subunit dehydrogenase